ncbi:hypothetical protein FKP32DRAFT_1594763 [Trametes sanguinea]|nr:hypothetical protein FKP32DRAFT_1594763 [Trametes sanguinea]
MQHGARGKGTALSDAGTQKVQKGAGGMLLETEAEVEPGVEGGRGVRGGEGADVGREADYVGGVDAKREDGCRSGANDNVAKTGGEARAGVVCLFEVKLSLQSKGGGGGGGGTRWVVVVVVTQAKHPIG